MGAEQASDERWEIVAERDELFVGVRVGAQKM
jgi:hypothetical protein